LLKGYRVEARLRVAKKQLKLLKDLKSMVVDYRVVVVAGLESSFFCRINKKL
jgi:hypothetical protein